MRLTLLEGGIPEKRMPKGIKVPGFFKPTHKKKRALSKKVSGQGGKTKFHGAFSDSKDAEAKHKTIPGSFIKPVKIRGKSRYAVIERLS